MFCFVVVIIVVFTGNLQPYFEHGNLNITQGMAGIQNQAKSYLLLQKPMSAIVNHVITVAPALTELTHSLVNVYRGFEATGVKQVSLNKVPKTMALVVFEQTTFKSWHSAHPI